MTNEDSIEAAVVSGDWNRARLIAAQKVARMMDKTESPREVKALAISLKDLVDKCEKVDVTESRRKSPAGRTLEQVRKVRK